MCDSRKYPYPSPSPRKTFGFAPPSPRIFRSRGSSDPPLLRNFQNFCTYKKESEYQLSYLITVGFYYNSVNIRLTLIKI